MFVFVFGSRLLYLPGCAKLTHASPLPHFVFGQWHCVAIIFASLFVFLLKCALVFLLNYLSAFLFKFVFLLKCTFVFVGASCRVILPPCRTKMRHTLFFFCICCLFVFVFVAAERLFYLPVALNWLTSNFPPALLQPTKQCICICRLHLSFVFVTCICHLYLYLSL